MKATIPNLLTLLRYILAVALPLMALLGAEHTWLFIVFVMGAASDAEGFIARTFNMESDWGKKHDPKADKWLVRGAAVTVLYLYPANILLWLFLLLNLTRDYFIDILRDRATQPLDVIKAAKYKTACQMVGLAVVLAGFVWAGVALLGLAAYLAVYSGWQYVQSYKTFK